MGNKFIAPLPQKLTRGSLPTNQYGYVKFTTVIRTLCENYDVSDLRHVADGLKKILKDYSIKEGKCACTDWKALWTANTRKNAKDPVQRCHYHSLTKLAEKIAMPTRFLDFVVRDSLMRAVQVYKATGNFFLDAVLPETSDIALLCNHDISTNYNLANSYVDSLKFAHRATQETVDNLMHVSDLPVELFYKREAWLHGVEGIYRIHGVNFNREDIIAASDSRAATDFTGNQYGRLVHTSVKSSLIELYNGLSALHKRGQVMLFIGGPGRGKTYEAIAASSEKSTIWSLSNTVAFNGARRTRDSGKKSTPMSFEKVRYMKMLGTLDQVDANDVLVDETSQMGCGDIDILLNAIAFVNRTGGKLLLMGDLNQIPSFLSRGSLLFSIVSEFPEFTRELTVNHRVDESSRIIADSSVNFASDGRVNHFEPFMLRYIPEDALKSLDPETVFITGANSQTSAINAYKLNQAIPGINLPLDGTDPCDFMRNNKYSGDVLIDYMRTRKLEFMATETEQLEKTLKIMTNERFYCWVEGPYVKVVSRVDNEKAGSMRPNTFFKYFTPAYAINVNKAQGLEWDNVILTFGDVFKPNGEDLKSNFLLRNSFEHLYVGATRARKSLSVFVGNLYTKDVQLFPVRKFNLFKEI